MRSITFTPEDLAAIAHERYAHPDPHVQRQMTVLWLHDVPQSADQVAAEMADHLLTGLTR